MELPSQVHFMWPVDAWVVATDERHTGEEHSGSADLGAPYGTPVAAAREGRVTLSEVTDLGGNTLVIDHGQGYSTLYSHLLEPANVAVGDEVTTGQRVGRVGRTGHAFDSGAHLHFAIRHENARLRIPGLDFGQWVQRGSAVTGNYDLTEVAPAREEAEVVVVHDGVRARTTPAQDSEAVVALGAGERLTVLGYSLGYYYLRFSNTLHGWVPHSAVRPADVIVRSVRITAMSARVRSAPSLNAPIVGFLPHGTVTTVFEARSSYLKVLFGLPAIYAWTHMSNTETTEAFDAAVRSPRANVRSEPSIEAEVVGALTFGEEIRIDAQHHGWYHIANAETEGWMAGWLTQGRR